MKKILLFIALSTFGNSNSQTLDFNNASAGTGNAPGILFNSIDSSSSGVIAGYEIPKASGLKPIFNVGVWCTATDINGQVKLALMKYGQQGHDFFPGPVSSINGYTTAAYLNEYGDLSNPNASKWYVTKTEIQNHIVNGSQVGYVIPASIANWPGNGIAGLGVEQNLAPFVDMNSNDIYEPSLGDYPDIRGDAAYYMIMNDISGVHTESGGDPLGIEIHTLMYQYASSDYLDSTTFLNFRVFNRGTATYSNFKFGLFSDFDLGAANDDYMGCDTTTNLMYVYNGTNDDVLGYGQNPPSVGITSLNKSMSHFYSYSNAAAMGSPSNAVQYFNVMSGFWPNGAPFTYGGTGSGGTIPTNYLFPGNPNDSNSWSQLSSLSGDRKGVMVIEEVFLGPNDEECYDFAVLFSRDQGNNNLQNVNSIIVSATNAKTDFDAMTTYNCNQVTLGQKELNESQIGLFPNPTSGKFTLSFGDELVTGELVVTDMKGRVVLREKMENKNVKILNLDTENGIYNVSIITESNTVHKRLIITE